MRSYQLELFRSRAADTGMAFRRVSVFVCVYVYL